MIYNSVPDRFHGNNVSTPHPHQGSHHFPSPFQINIVKMTVQPKAIYRFNVVAIKSSMTIFNNIDPILLKFI